MVRRLETVCKSNNVLTDSKSLQDLCEVTNGDIRWVKSFVSDSDVVLERGRP
jgi:hypothetical protein